MTIKKRALLIGINSYPLLDDLKYAERDATKVAEALQTYYGFKENEIVLMTSRVTGAKQANQRFIEKQLQHLRDIYHGLELLLVGFWGHGFLHENRRYLCATDTDEEELAKSGISFDSLLGTVAQAGAQNTCIILDCCQKETGRGISNTFTEAEEAAMVQGMTVTARDIGVSRCNRGITSQVSPSLAILNSCSAGQRAFEWEERTHGIFTAHLLDAMSQRMSGVSQLAGYVSQHVPITASGFSKRQVPYFKLEGGGDVPLAPYPPTHVGGSPVMPPSASSVSVLTSVEDEADAIYQRLKMEEEVANRREEAERLARERIERERLESTRSQRELVGNGNTAGERKVLTIKGVDYAFRWCPPGTFMMGSYKSEPERCDDEPRHQVTLSNGFWMLETQVTQVMWESVIGNNPSHFKGAQLPVETVCWNGCQEFIDDLNVLCSPGTLGSGFGGFKFSLPTEAQWEYACRAGTTTPFHFGSVLNGDKANCDGNHPYGTTTKGKYLAKTSVAGSYPANAWGLYDMHGNVWEWCSDWYAAYPNGAVVDPVGPSSGTDRVFRGGGWGRDAGGCRSAIRGGYEPSGRSNYLGLRLSLVGD